MSFKCQEDAFLRECRANVISCEPSSFCSTTNVDDTIHGYNVILDETIFFPEGGGQPCDYGTLNGKAVKNVVRRGTQAVLFVDTTEPFAIGQSVEQVIDWPRRLDHMQQHSGQHLITALFDREYDFNTKSWWLGASSSYIELDAKNVTKDQLSHVEELANSLIFEGRRVYVTVTTKEDLAEFQKFTNLRPPRGLPADHTGPIRIVTIGGIESNMCCGTHVNNLSQLQMVKLLNVEQLKNKLVVHFLIGKRVLKKLGECFQRELQMNVLLKSNPESHIELIQKSQTNTKEAQKAFKKVLKDLAVAEAEKLNATSPLPYYYSLHRNDGVEPDFIKTFLRSAPTGIFYFLTVSDSSGKGQMTLSGDSAAILNFGHTFDELLQGKGNNNGGIYQSKIQSVGKIQLCEEMMKEYFL